MATNKPKANTLGSMFALVVSLKVKPDQRDKFLAAAEDDSICSPRDEPGCLRFDVLQDQADENHFFFYEVYRDQAAFQEHGKAPHYARWSAVRDEVLVEPPQATRTTTLFPRDYR
jgi:(4S)-4-hydroxy-5-phosphonooxypentane-2,3-dione isomerase